eukprot:COSAG02_NODE_45850_length_353_cov_1.413386_1_plen_22_part_01
MVGQAEPLLQVRHYNLLRLFAA